MHHREGCEPLPWVIRNFIMKKYASHRGAPAFVLAAVDKDLKSKKRKWGSSDAATAGLKRAKIENLLSSVQEARATGFDDRNLFNDDPATRFGWWPMGSGIN